MKTAAHGPHTAGGTSRLAGLEGAGPTGPRPCQPSPRAAGDVTAAGPVQEPGTLPLLAEGCSPDGLTRLSCRDCRQSGQRPSTRRVAPVLSRRQAAGLP